MAERFDHQAIEKAAQKKWEALGLYKADLASGKDPYYLLVEFPYPSGDLHIGHWYAFAMPDILARYERMKGKEVLFPIGLDAFGLPAENAAIKNSIDPAAWTKANIERMRGQLASTGASFDWSRELATCDPSYYRWTQWLFLKFLEHGLAVRKSAAVKWCPKDLTVLANEQIIDGCCERCGTEVVEKELTQWFLKITDYADRLLADLEPLPWREEIKEAQRAWIGKSEGAKLRFPLEGHEGSIEVFTTRPDTLFGVTYVVLAPEHPLVERLLPMLPNKGAVEAYLSDTRKKTERERSESKDKTGVALEDVLARNPATGEVVPVYVADYVLGSYGTGAVMAVPAHDERDAEFAAKHGLPVRHVVMPDLVDEGNPPVEGKPTVTRHSILAIVRNPEDDTYLALKWKKQPWTTFITGGIDPGEDVVEAARREVQEETGYRDLKLVRVLGGPVHARFFAAHKGENRIAINTSVLFELAGSRRDEVAAAELAEHEAAWLSLEEIRAERMRHAEIGHILSRMQGDAGAYTGDGVLTGSGAFDGRGSREAMKDIVTAAGGEWATQYRLRDWLVSRQRYWGCPIPVVYDPDGNPHPVPADHLPWLLPTDADFKPNEKGAPLATSQELKERVTKLFGEGWTPEYDTLDTFVDSSWYYARYLDPKDDHDFSDQAAMKKWLPVNRYAGGAEHTTMHLLYSRFFYKALHDLALAPTSEPFHERFNRGLILGPDGQKMSKSKGNVINPDEYVRKYGADAVRVFLAFMGPYNEPGSYPFSLEGVGSMRKFLERAVAVVAIPEGGAMTPELSRAFARAASKAGEDIERFKLNTAVSALMVLVRELQMKEALPQEAKRQLAVLLAPFAPHLAEYLWERVGGEGSVHTASWPSYDAALLAEETVSVAVQVNGKRRGEVQLQKDAAEAEALAAAQGLPAVASILGGKPPARVVYVPGRILNLVAVEE
jgi:leucyl-tRNA synthetase